MKLGSWLLDRPTPYRAWQALFADAKFEPIVRHNDLGTIGRVLDVGCGPGTNAHYFGHTTYVGLDSNPRYIESAAQRNRGRFVVADARTYREEDSSGYDFILLNSLLHHLETADVRLILDRVRALLAPEGHVHILDLVLPERASPARLLARWDRGKHARRLDEWRHILERCFEPLVSEPYVLSALGVPLWHMLYFKGRKLR